MARRSGGSRGTSRDSLAATEDTTGEQRTNGDSLAGTPQAKAKKPPRPTDWNALPPNFAFKIESRPPGQAKKRKRSAATDVIQKNPWNTKLDTTYAVSPAKAWEDTSRFRKFTLQGETFSAGQDILVSQSDGTTDIHIPNWVARVLEVRAGDEQHVYLRVYWLYRPEDLPGGRKPYHGRNELIASNHMEIIDAMTCNGPANVRHWKENEGDSEMLDPEQLFWRQTYNCHTGELSDVPKYCIDSAPYNPDTVLVGCTNLSCNAWFHATCLEREAIKQAYKKHNLTFPSDATLDSANAKARTPALATKPAISLSSPVKTSEAPLQTSPKAANGASDSVEGSTSPDAMQVDETASQESERKRVKTDTAETTGANETTSPALRSSPTAESKAESEPIKSMEVDTIEPEAAEVKSVVDTAETTEKSDEDRAAEEAGKLLFSATLITGTGDEKPKIHMVDLRSGRDKAEWDESIKCLECDHTIA